MQCLCERNTNKPLYALNLAVKKKDLEKLRETSEARGERVGVRGRLPLKNEVRELEGLLCE